MTAYNPPPGQTPYGAPRQASPALAITSMVLGILSIVTFCVPILAILLGIGALVLAMIARPKIARGEAGGRGMATAGMITGGIGLVLAIIVFILSMVYGTKIMNWAEEQQRLQQQQQQSAP